VNSLDITGRTPLHAASRNGRLDVVQLLPDHGADVNARKQDQWTALHLAILGRSVEVVKVLLEQGADIFLCGMTSVIRHFGWRLGGEETRLCWAHCSWTGSHARISGHRVHVKSLPELGIDWSVCDCMDACGDKFRFRPSQIEVRPMVRVFRVHVWYHPYHLLSRIPMTFISLVGYPLFECL
jgi:hypothetical protein